MRPEEDMTALVRGVCQQSGHWPYTRKADLYIGFRPAGDKLLSAGDRTTGTEVEYDIVICGTRGMAAQMEALRYRLYAALRAGGWRLSGAPGPEAYVEAHELFLWPLSAVKRYAMDEEGLPEDPVILRTGGA